MGSTPNRDIYMANTLDKVFIVTYNTLLDNNIIPYHLELHREFDGGSAIIQCKKEKFLFYLQKLNPNDVWVSFTNDKNNKKETIVFLENFSDERIKKDILSIINKIN